MNSPLGFPASVLPSEAGCVGSPAARAATQELKGKPSDCWTAGATKLKTVQEQYWDDEPDKEKCS